MNLIDAGNTFVKIFIDGKISGLSPKEFLKFSSKERFYFINVNQNLNQKFKKHKNFINLKEYFEFKTNYTGLGIDRIAACYTIKNGVVVDAGSAITVDVMEDGFHKGGFIMPGINIFLNAFEEISPVLKTYFNSNLDISKLPNSTSDALNYTIISSVINLIKNISTNQNIFFTGGDGEFFSRFFTNSIYDKNLIFRAMQMVVKKNFNSF